MATDKNSIIFERRHPQIKDKESVWQLIHDSYRGGTYYADGNYLYPHAKEGATSFANRKDRAVYFNQIQPLADLLAGFLFINRPARKNVEAASWLIENATDKGTTMDEFMKTVAIHSVQFTCGILVDSPDFDPELIKTEKDRKENKLNPYCTLYLPFQIRDFHIGKDGKIEWVLLDNTTYDNSDPFKEGVERVIYRLWTKDSYQDFELIDGETGVNSYTIDVSEEVPHSLGIVPFRFVNWKDDNEDFIAESVFEDPASISRLIYNKLSEMDEMIAAGSFRVLMYPTTTGILPPEMITSGIGALSAIPFDGTLSQAPFFDGAKLEDVQPFLKAIEFYVSEILKKIGLDTDETKDYVKSGLAKQIDFQKVKSLLVSGSMAMAELEIWIFKTAAMWMGKESKAEVHYSTHYADEDILTEVQLLSELLIFPFKRLRQSVIGLLVKSSLTGKLPQTELDEIYAEIESESDSVVDKEEALNNVDVKSLAVDEQATADTELQN